MEIEGLRRNYDAGKLDFEQLCSDPIDQFAVWFEQAKQSSSAAWFEVNAMTLATSTADGSVTSRIILLKQFGAEGFTFFTNYDSNKGRQLAENPRASLLFYWPHIERQVRIDGQVAKTDAATSEAYFQARPRESQIGAVVSPQSQVIDQQHPLAEAAKELSDRLAGGAVSRPVNWGGYLLKPVRIEFWQGRPNRLHDRCLYTLQSDGSWQIARLAP
ncbi:MAG: pyridoxamine 5'-phosphate oxidase [Planctomycetales bacterium]|nr:pyridoxamine 5'-phosphate oxidase [Planctomycetales bacterium]